MRLALLGLLIAAGIFVAGVSSASAAPPTASTGPRLIALGGHFGGGGFGRGGFGRGGFGRRGFGSGGFGRHSSSRGLLHRIARALAFAYILHLLLSHGAISILLWLIVIGLLVLFVRRRRRRRRRDRYSY